MKRLAAAVLVVLALPAAADAATQPVRLDASRVATLTVEAPRYRLVLDRRHGALVRLVDRGSGRELVRGSKDCAWLAVVADRAHARGCSYSPRGRARFTWRWHAPTATLTLLYRGGPRADATVTMRFAAATFDQRLSLTSRTPATIDQVAFPADLVADTAAARAGYAPNFLPGLRFGPAFFARVGNNLRTYPSRWAFADFLALDLRGGSLALSTVNPAPAPLAPVTFGFVRDARGTPCSGRAFCVRHAFQTWIRRGETWRSPLVRIRVGATAREAVLAHRRENRIDRYPALAAKAPELQALARAPLVKADPWKTGVPFREWGEALRRLPSPSLLHPVAMQPGGHDALVPDVLPPDPRWGTLDELRATLAEARSLGHLVMPYLNASWWDAASPTARSIPGGISAVATRDAAGEPVAELYGEREGWVVTPFAAQVRARLRALADEWQQGLGAACTFLDQLGARPWVRDFSPLSPGPLAYYDGWLEAIEPLAAQCVTVEDGWDRLARSAAAFHGSALLLHREHDELDRLWGRGTWEPYPLALWLLRDKVLLYQHDLAPETMTDDLEVLLWNAVFGYQLSYDWTAGSLDSPWLDVAGDVQRALGPLHAGVPLASYARAGAVSESRFGRLAVTGNWSGERPLVRGGTGIAPHGFHARTADGTVIAGAFEGSFGGAALAPGVHVVVVERQGGAVEVRHPLGADTPIAVAFPDGPVRVAAHARDGRLLAETATVASGGRVVVLWRRELGGAEVRLLRVTRG